MPRRTTTEPSTGVGSKSTISEELIREHLPLVQYIVSDFSRRLPRSIERDDLVAAGMLGLTQAAVSFDDSRQVSFARYARIRINGAILDDLRSRDFATRSVRSSGRVLDAETQRLTSELGRVPTQSEIAKRVGVSIDELARMRAELDRAVIDTFDTWNDDVAFPSTGSTDPLSVLMGREDQSYVRDAIAALPERLRRVVVGYFIDDRPMLELAEELGVTESRISQMRKEALLLMGEALRAVSHSAVAGAERSNKDIAEASDSLGARVTADPTMDHGLVGPGSDGVAARRRAAYVHSVMAASDYRSRISPAAFVVAHEAV
jgi:RNA polymerase sigma factor FliA